MSERLVVFTEREEGPVPGLDEELIRQNGGTIRYGKAVDESDRVRLAERAEVMVVGMAPLTRGFLAAVPLLKGVVRLGIGVDSVDLEAATDLGIVVANVPDFCSEEVAEHALGLIFAVTRKLALADRRARAGQWVAGMDALLRPMWRLSGQTLGLIGLGKIGRTLARRAQGLGLKVIAYDPHVRAEAAQAAGVTLMSLEALLPQTNILSLHVPVTAETKGIVNARTLALLKPGAILINAARGPVVDEPALAAALASGRLAGAGLDVLQQEPLRLPHPLAEFENVVFTCHYASLSEESYAIMRQQVSEQAVQILRGEFPVHLVNPRVKDLPQCRLRKSDYGRDR
ncbi:MAG TPA: C-terminal binding protein [Terriglobia bacterium]|nr:C-terminal binding protein [Terriglobia bacterium]